MNLQQLRYLVEVADGPSLSAAARRLGISQPALSRAIRNLEMDLGTDLVVLDGRRLHVRADAAPVITAARGALVEVERVAAVASRLHAREVTIAASPSHQWMLVAHLPELARLAGATVRLLTANDTDDLAKLVRAGRADLGVGEATGAPVYDLQVRPLGVLELVLAAAVGHLSDVPDPVSLEEVSPLRIAVLDNADRMKLLEKLVAERGGSLDPVFMATDRSVLLRAVEAGVAPTIAPHALVHTNLRLEHRHLSPPIGYPVAALVDASRATAMTDAVLGALVAVDWR